MSFVVELLSREFLKYVQLLLIKLLLTPLLMIAVSWAARRWGSGIGGFLAGLPLTSGPISIYLWVEQGLGVPLRSLGHTPVSDPLELVAGKHYRCDAEGAAVRFGAT